MYRIIILGAGRIGEAVALELSPDYAVALADHNEDRLHALGAKLKVVTAVADLSDLKQIEKAIEPYELVIGAVPGFLGYVMARTVIDAGKNLVDVSFFEEDPFTLDELARKRNVIACVDCGIAPGLFNMMVGHEDTRMKLNSMTCYVGGLPANPQPPWYYKAPYSPVDVIEFYKRPARIMENGKVVVKEALSELETIQLQLGTLEAFNSDGLRTLLTTMAHIPNMKEKTFRWPKHAEYIKVLRDSGFFSEEPITVNGQQVIPRDVNSQLLFRQWKLNDDDDEFTVMRVALEGDKGNVTYDVFDKRDKQTGLSSMARTTGFTCAAVARLFLEEKVLSPGVQAPEEIGTAGHFSEVVERLRRHGVRIERSEIQAGQ